MSLTSTALLIVMLVASFGLVTLITVKHSAQEQLPIRITIFVMTLVGMIAVESLVGLLALAVHTTRDPAANVDGVITTLQQVLVSSLSILASVGGGFGLGRASAKQPGDAP